jgi:hypothetical protein
MLKSDEAADAVALASEFGVEVDIHSPPSLETWLGILTDLSIAVHLRVSTSGDLGPFAATSLARGNFTLVSEFGEDLGIAQSLLVPIRVGIHEIPDLIRAIELEIARPDDERLARAEAQRRAARELLSPEMAAADLCALYSRGARRITTADSYRW